MSDKPNTIGLDIDGTITSAPAFYSRVSRYTLARGGEVHIVSSRSQASYADTAEELSAYGMQWTSLYLLPSISMAKDLCPPGELDWYQRYLWLKVRYAREHYLDCFVDDDAKVLSLFQTYAPDVLALPATGNFEELEAILFGRRSV